MLKFQNVFKTYHNGSYTLHALNNVSLSFKNGEFVFLLGPSGSGKSTLLNVLSGLDVPSQGVIHIDGVDTNTFSKKDWAIYRNQHIGFIFQEYNLVEHLSVLENVALPLLFQGITRKEALERAFKELKAIGLEKHVEKKPLHLSGGQQQRTAIARALVINPKIILADEPTGALDTDLGFKVVEYLKNQAKDKLVIVVTHDEELAHTFATRTLNISDGLITHDSKAHTLEIVSHDKPYLKAPKMRFSMLMKFAKNNVASRMFRSLFTSSIVAIGFVAILLLTFIILGIRGSLSDSIASVIPPNQYQIHTMENTTISDSTFDKIQTYPEVEILRYHMNIPLETQYQNQPPMNAIYEAIPYDELAFQRDGTLHGRLPENSDEVVINLTTALVMREIQHIDEDSYEYLFNLVEGQTLSVLENEKALTIVGMAAGNVYEGPKLYMDYEALLAMVEDLEISQEYKRSAVAYLNTNDDDTINQLIQTLRDDDDIVLRNIFGEVNDQIETIMNNALKWFVGIAAITLFVSGILVGLVVYTSVLERIKEIGILTALGVRRQNIRTIFVLESGMSGLLAGVIAIVAALFLANVLNRLFNTFIEAPLNLITGGDLNFTLLSASLLPIVLVLFGGVIYTMLAGLIPSYQAAKLDAIKALRKE